MLFFIVDIFTSLLMLMVDVLVIFVVDEIIATLLTLEIKITFSLFIIILQIMINSEVDLTGPTLINRLSLALDVLQKLCH